MFKKVENRGYIRKKDLFDVSINRTGALYLTASFMKERKIDIKMIDIYIDKEKQDIFFCINNMGGQFRRGRVERWQKQRFFPISKLLKDFELGIYRGNRYNTEKCTVNGEYGFKIKQIK
jgi:hypothetical protein